MISISKDGGLVMVELLLVVPILVFIALATVEITRIMKVDQALSSMNLEISKIAYRDCSFPNVSGINDTELCFRRVLNGLSQGNPVLDNYLENSKIFITQYRVKDNAMGTGFNIFGIYAQEHVGINAACPPFPNPCGPLQYNETAKFPPKGSVRTESTFGPEEAGVLLHRVEGLSSEAAMKVAVEIFYPTSPVAPILATIGLIPRLRYDASIT